MKRLSAAIAGCLVVAFLVSLGACSSSSSGSSNTILRWNSLLLDAVRTNKTNPPQASRQLAMLHIAMFDAVNAGSGTYYTYSGSDAGLSSDERASAAAMLAATAAYHVLTTLYPSTASAAQLELDGTLPRLSTTALQTKVATVGKAAADAIIALRKNDSGTTGDAAPATADGVWQPTPPANAAALLPGWGKLTPFAMTSGSQFRQSGPPALSSATYATEFEEVRRLGSKTSTERTEEQTNIAKFWSDDSGTETPPGHWNSIARSIAEARGLGVSETVRLFALLNIALADAAIAAWDMKFHSAFYFWRPITAIRDTDDGNTGTTQDAAWEPLLTTPSFPDYVSGHSTFSAAAAELLTQYFGTDAVSFSTTSDGLPGVTRNFTSLVAAAQEAGQSRVYGGIHFQSANQDGLKAGKAIARHVWENALKPR